MIPVDGPQETESKAEISIYYLLKRALSDDFTVIHSLPWLAAAATEINENSAPTGEIDFLVLHAELGVLALEVKGGKYKVQGLRFVHTTKNFSISPLTQVRRNTHGLAEWLGADPSLRWKIHYGLIFPHSDFGDAIVNAALVDVTVKPAQKILVDRQELPRIGERINEIMQYWRSTLRQPALGAIRLKKIIDAICPEFDGTPQWGTRASYDKRMWLKLTAEQTEVVNAVDQQSKALITGWPGTGKTIIAIEIARQKLSAGKKVLFLTFNKLLSEYVQTQLGDVNAPVLTWHSFCAKFARSNRQETAKTDDWLEAGCLREFNEAVCQNQIPNFDTIVIDEAQTFRTDWIAALCQWHPGSIVAFCDATQVFSFERDRVSIDDLCRQLNVIQPYVLTVPLRSPKAVFDRLRAIRPPSYQTYSPRELELDSLQEKLVADVDEALSSTLSELVKAGLNPSDIAVLSKFGWHMPGQQTNAFFETVSRFRGLEASAIVICNAEKMDDLELFSAYSRATSICIALYDAETLGAKPSTASFHQTLLDSPINAEKVQTAFQRAQTRGVVDTYLQPDWLPLTTVEIGWCSAWGSWVIARGQLHVFSDLWMDYLLSHYSWPVFIWSGDAIRKVELYQPDAGQHNVDFNNPLETLRCESCGKVTPQKRMPSGTYSCLFCSGFPANLLGPQSDLIEKLTDLDSVIAMSPRTRTAIQLKALPLSLAAAALTKYAHENARRKTARDSDVNFGSGVYRAAMAFVYAYIALLSEGKTIVAAALVSKTYNSYTVPDGLTEKQWKEMTDRALAVCFNNRGLLRKIRKGVYMPISRVHLNEPD